MSASSPTLVFKLLPGPDRKRTEHCYSYQLVYSQPALDEPGCVRLWHVGGGRLPYQIALERDDSGNLHFHCTCADAIFRAEAENRLCKHVRGLLDFNHAVESRSGARSGREAPRAAAGS